MCYWQHRIMATCKQSSKISYASTQESYLGVKGRSFNVAQQSWSRSHMRCIDRKQLNTSPLLLGLHYTDGLVRNRN